MNNFALHQTVLSETPIPSVITTPYLIAALICFFIMIVCWILLFFKKPVSHDSQSHHRHSHIDSNDQFYSQLDTVVTNFREGLITSEQAYADLAIIAKTFASQRMGKDLSSQTLFDLNTQYHNNNKTQYENLRLTIAALYPAEFANAQSNTQAKDTDVETAAGWVDAMISRWSA